MSTPAASPAPPLSARAQITRYAVVVTVLGVVVFASALAVPAVSGLGGVGLLGAGIVTVLLGRSVGWIALVAPLIPAAVWAASFAVMIAVGTETGSDTRGFAILFAFLAIGLVIVGGEICALAGAIWGAAARGRRVAGDARR